MKKRLGATDNKIIRTLRDGAIDSTVSIAQLSGIHFGIVTQSLYVLIHTGYVIKSDNGYSLSAKGRVMADSLHEIWLRRKTK